MSAEIWKDIPGYEGSYQASTLGRIRSLDRVIECWNGRVMVKKELQGIILKPSIRDGYAHVVLFKKLFKLHRLIATTFLSFDLKSKLVINHLDGNKLNNELNNLEVTTQSGNIKHAFKTGARGLFIGLDGEKKNLKEWAKIYNIKYDTVWNRIRIGWSYEDAIKTPVYNKKGEY